MVAERNDVAIVCCEDARQHRRQRPSPFDITSESVLCSQVAMVTISWRHYQVNESDVLVRLTVNYCDITLPSTVKESYSHLMKESFSGCRGWCLTNP